MNKVQKFLQKALGFPPWRGSYSTTDIIPGGWGSLDPYGRYSQLLDIPAFVGCVRVLCSISSLPWHVYEEKKSGDRVKAVDHPAYLILHDSPNSWMTSVELRQFLILHYCMCGNSFAEIVRLNDRFVGLNPLQTGRMNPKMDSSGLVYEYTYEDGKTERFPPEKVFHLKNFTSDGIHGLPHVPDALLKRAIVTHNFGAAVLRNQGFPGVVLETDKPRPRDNKDVERLKSEWQSLYSGENVGKTAALYDGMKAHVVTMSPENAQFIDTMKQINAEFAGIFGIPLNLLDFVDRTETFASAEQFNLQFVRYVLGPLAKSIEQAFNKKIFRGQPQFYSEFDFAGLERGDLKAQADYFSAMVDHGNMTNDEFRQKMNLQPFGGLSAKPRCQSNMIPVADLGKLALAAQSNPGQAVGDIRKDTEPSETGFQMHIQKMEQTVLPPKPMKKSGRAKRLADGTITFEIEEHNHGA